MTIIVYVCDVCDREIDIPLNKRGLEVIQRCTITDDCRGKLHQIDVKQDFIRGQLPTPVSGLDDWIPRRLLYNHIQSVSQQSWIVIHNLGVLPTINVFVERTVTGTIEEITGVPCEVRTTGVEEASNLSMLNPDDFSINIIDDNSFEVILTAAERGQVQCVARSSAPSTRTLPPTIDPISEFQLTSNSELTIATVLTSPVISIGVTIIHPDGFEDLRIYAVDDTPSVLSSAWVDIDQVFINNKLYTVRSFPMNVPTQIPDGSTMIITDIDGPIVPGSESTVILLSNDPHSTQDKIYDRYVDATLITPTESQNFYFNNNQLFTRDSNIRAVYPHIRRV